VRRRSQKSEVRREKREERRDGTRMTRMQRIGTDREEKINEELRNQNEESITNDQ